MHRFIKIIIAAFLIQLSWTTLAQPRSDTERDQLLKELQSNIDDTTRVLKLQDLSRYYILKVGEDKVDMDKAYNYVKQSETLSNTIGYDRGKWISFILYSQLYREGGNVSKGKELLNKAFRAARMQNDLWLSAECLREFSQYFDNLRYGVDKKIIILNNAIKVSIKGGSLQQQADLLLFLSFHYYIVGNFREALACQNKVKLISQKTTGINTQELYNNIAKTNLKLGMYNEAVSNGLIAIKQAEKSNFNFYLSHSNNTVGLAYYNMGNYNMALQYHKKALNYSYKNFEDHLSNWIFYNLMKDYLKLQQYSESQRLLDDYMKNKFKDNSRYYEYLLMSQIHIYDGLQQFEISKGEVKKLVHIFKKTKTLYSEIFLLEMNSNLIVHYFKTKEYDSVKDYLNRNKVLFKKLKDINILNENQLYEFKIDSAQGNYLKAIASLKKYHKTKDSLFNETKAYQIANLQIQYETDKKDRNIHSLTNESLVQKVVIEKDRVTKLVISLVLILFSIIICLLFRRYKSKIKSNKALIVKQNEIENMNDSLKLYVQEKELLLKEIHHRVKNNLQIVMSLLNSQSNYLTDNASIVAIKDSQNRIYSMALIHQKLYQSEGICVIKMPEYIRELVGYLRDSYQNNLDFDIKVDDISLDTTIAIPVGLIINEALTNIFKHAFPENGKGVVTVQLTYYKDSMLKLEIHDNGIGIPKSIDLTQLNSLGMSLMEGLSREINGSLKVTNYNGTIVSVYFSQISDLNLKGK